MKLSAVLLIIGVVANVNCEDWPYLQLFASPPVNLITTYPVISQYIEDAKGSTANIQKESTSILKNLESLVTALSSNPVPFLTAPASAPAPVPAPATTEVKPAVTGLGAVKFPTS